MGEYALKCIFECILTDPSLHNNIVNIQPKAITEANMQEYNNYNICMYTKLHVCLTLSKR